MSCPGSANLELAIPGYTEPPKDDMKGAKGEGTLLHKSMERFGLMPSHELWEYSEAIRELSKLHWTKRRPLLVDPIKLEDFLYQEAPTMDATAVAEFIALAPDFVPLAPKKLKYVADCAEYLSERFEGFDKLMVPSQAYRVEEPLVAEWLPSKSKTTPDVTVVTRFLLEVFDYKTGAIPVSAFENDQQMFYAACKLHLAPDATEFTVHILQDGNMDSWTAPIQVLKDWMQRAIRTDMLIAQKNLQLKPSDHCTFCPANPHTRGDRADMKCPAMVEMLYPPVIDEDEILG